MHLKIIKTIAYNDTLFNYQYAYNNFGINPFSLVNAESTFSHFRQPNFAIMSHAERLDTFLKSELAVAHNQQNTITSSNSKNNFIIINKQPNIQRHAFKIK